MKKKSVELSQPTEQRPDIVSPSHDITAERRLLCSFVFSLFMKADGQSDFCITFVFFYGRLTACVNNLMGRRLRAIRASFFLHTNEISSLNDRINDAYSSGAR